MTLKTVNMIWFGASDSLSPEQSQALEEITEKKCSIQVIPGTPINYGQGQVAELVREVLQQTLATESIIIAGDFSPALAASLVKSQTYGGRFGGFVILLPVMHQGVFRHWEVFL